MKLYKDDLKNIKIDAFSDKPVQASLLDALPPIVKDMQEDDYLVFYYAWDDKSFKLSFVSDFKLVKDITQQLWRNRPTVKQGQFTLPAEVAFFKLPFDSQNALFYGLMKYLITEGRPENAKILHNLMAQFKAKDLEEKQSNPTELNCSYPIQSRSDYETALDRYILVEKIVVNDILTISDYIDQYCKVKSGRSFYGGWLKKVVTAVRNPNGGLITEDNGTLDYIYVGVKSELVKTNKDIQDRFEQAKAMLRGKQTSSEVFAKTGWAYNNFDGKWRFKISDGGAKLRPTKDVFMGRDNPFQSEIQDIRRAMLKDDMSLEGYIKRGWTVTLGDILEHPTLFQHYPHLYRMPVFYGVTDHDSYSFYFSPSGFINLIGNPANFDLLTVLLHEIQHAIQHLEGFGTGGNQELAKIIQGMGGNNFREYLFTKQKIVELYKKGMLTSYRHERFMQFYIAEAKFRGATGTVIGQITEDDYNKDYKQIVDYMIRGYAMGLFPNKTNLKDYLRDEIFELFENIGGWLRMGEKAVAKLRATGYSDADISTIIFKTYETLLGEVESRDIQHSYAMSEDEASYLAPYTTETIYQKDVTVVVDDLAVDEIVGIKKIKGACEKAIDGKYILHFFDSVSPEPILHEMAHILQPIAASEVKADIIKNIPSETIKLMGGEKEVFAELFLCYLVNKNISQTLTEEITGDRTLLEYTMFDKYFDRVFNPSAVPQPDEAEKYREFLTKLKEVVNG